jgi:hypothetical protein
MRRRETEDRMPVVTALVSNELVLRHGRLVVSPG